MTSPSESITVEGCIEKIRFFNPENFFTVATLKQKRKRLTLVGMLPGLAEGMDVRIEGQLVHNSKFGEQLQADHFTEIMPVTLEGVRRYLSSGLVPGIGKSFAQRIVDSFGKDTLKTLIETPERLKEVKGLGKKRAQLLEDTFKEKRDSQEALLFLMSLKIPKGTASRIFRFYRDETVATVRNNPFQLAEDVHGIGFVTADLIARALHIKKNHPERIKAGILHVFHKAKDDGHVRLENSVLVEIATQLLDVHPDFIETGILSLLEEEKICRSPLKEEQLYLSSLYEAERGAASDIERLCESTKIRKPKEEEVLRAASALGLTLAPLQLKAVLNALKEPVSIITGGPGTGKTTIIKTLLEVSPIPKERIALAAPTGRAAKRMSEATGRPALTLHRLLEYNPGTHAFQRDENYPIHADLVIVDEASMIDIVLFHSLLRALDHDTQLVLVGDKDQLPPVGPGQPLTDLIEGGYVGVSRLSEIFRQEKGSDIIHAAHAVNQGLPLAGSPKTDDLLDFYFVLRQEPEHIASLIETLVCERIPERFGFDPVKDVQILTPMRMGPIGVDALNERLQRRLNPHAKEKQSSSTRQEFQLGDKVMQLKNDYERNVFNGDIGYVVRKDKGTIYVTVDDRLVEFDKDAQQNLTLAYAITIHKSQGSEYPAIVVPVSTQHYKMLRRNLIYTAMTRGTQLVILVGTEQAMRIAVGNVHVETRNTGLNDYF